MSKKKLKIIVRNADGIETIKEEKPIKKIKIPTGQVEYIQSLIIKKQREYKQ